MINPTVGIVTSNVEMIAPAKPNRWRRYLVALLCIEVSGFFLYLAVPKADMLGVHKALGGGHAFALVAFMDFWLRAVRWSWMFPSKGRPTVRLSGRTIHGQSTETLGKLDG